MEFDVELDQQHLETLSATLPLTGVIELIWNALDADATEVKVELGRSELDGVEDIRVIDNGHGMTFEEAAEAFRRLGGSWKRTAVGSRITRRALHGRNGKGRFRLAGDRHSFSSESELLAAGWHREIGPLHEIPMGVAQRCLGPLHGLNHMLGSALRLQPSARLAGSVSRV